MDAIADEAMADDTRLPADIDAQPVVQAAAALQPVLARVPRRDRARAALPAAAGRADARGRASTAWSSRARSADCRPIR